MIFESEKSEPTLSNSRLGGSICYPRIFKVGVDRITIMGDIPSGNLEKFKKVIENTFELKVLKKMTDMIYFTVFNQVNCKYDKLSAEAMKKRNMRVEFNPNSLSEKELDFLQDKITSLMINKSFSRLDLAFDFESDLADYEMISTYPLKKTFIYGEKGNIETRYFGSRFSDRYIRIYDKKKERSVNGVMIEKDFFWRVEFELKKDECMKWENCLHDLNYVKPNWKNAKTLNDKMKLFALIHHPEFWGELDKKQKAKYKKMIVELAEIDIISDMSNQLEIEKNEMKLALDKWLS